VRREGAGKEESGFKNKEDLSALATLQNDLIAIKAYVAPSLLSGKEGRRSWVV
jgi:hypothetical protein